MIEAVESRLPLSILPSTPKSSWSAHYQEGDLRFRVDCDSWECPVTYIKPKSIELINIAGNQKRMHQAYGANPFDIASAPPYVTDALDLLECESIALSNARMDAQQDQR